MDRQRPSRESAIVAAVACCGWRVTSIRSTDLTLRKQSQSEGPTSRGEARGAPGSFVLEREEHSLVLCLLSGENGGVLDAADRDIAGHVGGARECEEGGEPYPAPPVVEPAPAFSAVKVCDELSVHQRAQLGESQARRSRDVATD